MKIIYLVRPVRELFSAAMKESCCFYSREKALEYFKKYFNRGKPVYIDNKAIFDERLSAYSSYILDAFEHYPIGYIWSYFVEEHK